LFCAVDAMPFGFSCPTRGGDNALDTMENWVLQIQTGFLKINVNMRDSGLIDELECIDEEPPTSLMTGGPNSFNSNSAPAVNFAPGPTEIKEAEDRERSKSLAQHHHKTPKKGSTKGSKKKKHHRRRKSASAGSKKKKLSPRVERRKKKEPHEVEDEEDPERIKLEQEALNKVFGSRKQNFYQTLREGQLVLAKNLIDEQQIICDIKELEKMSEQDRAKMEADISHKIGTLRPRKTRVKKTILDGDFFQPKDAVSPKSPVQSVPLEGLEDFAKYWANHYARQEAKKAEKAGFEYKKSYDHYHAIFYDQALEKGKLSLESNPSLTLPDSERNEIPSVSDEVSDLGARMSLALDGKTAAELLEGVEGSEFAPVDQKRPPKPSMLDLSLPPPPASVKIDASLSPELLSPPANIPLPPPIYSEESWSEDDDADGDTDDEDDDIFHDDKFDEVEPASPPAEPQDPDAVASSMLSGDFGDLPQYLSGLKTLGRQERTKSARRLLGTLKAKKKGRVAAAQLFDL